MRALAFSLLLFCGGCANQSVTTATRIRSAVDMAAVVVGPAAAFATTACARRQEIVATQAEAGKITVEAARTQLADERTRCTRLKMAFDLIRAIHEQARTLVESGELEKADALLVELRDEWSKLQGSL